MIRVIVSYPTKDGSKFDLDYYLTRHMPMVMEKLSPHGMTGWSVDHGIGGMGPGSPAEYRIQAFLMFDSIDQVQKGMAAEGGPILGDIPNYTDLQPVIQINEVLR